MNTNNRPLPPAYHTLKNNRNNRSRARGLQTNRSPENGRWPNPFGVLLAIVAAGLVADAGFGQLNPSRPTVLERVDTRLERLYYKRFEQEHAKDLDQQSARLNQAHADEIAAFEARIERMESEHAVELEAATREARSQRQDLSYGHADIQPLALGSPITAPFAATIQCQETEFGFTGTVIPIVNPDNHAWIYQNMGACFHNEAGVAMGETLGYVGEEIQVGLLVKLLP